MSAIHQALLMIGDEIRYWLSQRYPTEQPPEPFSAVLTIVKSWAFRDPTDAYVGSPQIMSGVLANIQINYAWPPEAYIGGVQIVSGVLANIQINYANPPEAFVAGLTANGGSLVVVQVFYNNWPPEAYSATVTAISGTLS